ncbi:MAG: hypothetical protein IKB11_01860 [Bacteroidaceae bacterium]|nr:hypothetical protein [Bacteroidaceae bacterium]
MRKFTFLFFSMFFMLGTSVAVSQEIADFNSPTVYPNSEKPETMVYNIRISFSKDITVTLPEGGIDVVNTTTQEVVKIANAQVYDWEPNTAVLEFEQKLVPGKDGKEELQPQYIETPGTYTYTIPAGCITSVDGDVFAEHTYTFSITSTFDVVGCSPKTTDKLEKVEITFEEEIVDVNMPEQGLTIWDMYYMNSWFTKSEFTLSEDKKSVTLELAEPITASGMYDLAIPQGIFVSANGINNYSTQTITIQDLTPSFYTNYDDENRVKEIPGLAIGFKNVSNVELVEGAAPVMVYLPGGGEAAGTAQIIEGSIIVAFDIALTEEGLYTFVIPAGMFKMDGVENESREVGVELYTFNLLPLEIVSITPAAGTVEQLDKIIIEFNQNVILAQKDWQEISREIKITDGVNEYTLTSNVSYTLSNKIEYVANAVWDGYGYASTPITAEGRYVLDLSDIILSYGAEKYIDEWGYENTRWNAQGSCEGTLVWTISAAPETGIDGVEAEDGEQVIYDLTGRRVKSITTPGIYIVNGVKVVK